MKRGKRLRNGVIYTFVFIYFIIGLFTNNTFASVGTIQYDGKITSGASSVGLFHVDGRIAFCMDHAKQTPPNGTEIAEKSFYSDPNIIKCLYYGWEGPGQWSGFGDDWKYGVVATTLALDHYANGSNKTIAREFIAFIDSASVPTTSLNFSTTNFTASVQGNKQVTNSATINGSSAITLQFNIPSDVTIVCENMNWSQTGGTVAVSNGDIIHFEAPLTKTGSWTSEQFANSYVWNAIVCRTYNDNLQRIVRLGERDPGTYTNFSIKFVDLGALEVYKTDSQTGQAIADTEFTITGPNGYTTTKKTDSNGYFKLEQIAPGDYKIVETKANSLYNTNSTTHNITVTPNATKTVRITNNRKTSTIRVLKVDSRDNTTPVQGCTFELYSSQDNYSTKKATKTTSSTGIIEFTDLRIGYTYKLRETATNQYYILDSTDKQIALNSTQRHDITISNAPKVAYLDVEKADVDYKDIKLSGFEFTIYEDSNKNGTLDSGDRNIQKLTTGSNGKTSKSQALYLDRTYFVKETNPRADYRTDYEVKKVTFLVTDQNKTLTYNFYNKKKDGGINVYKVDARDNKTPIQGAEFEIYSKEFNKVIQTGKTDKNGKVTFSNIRIGDVLVREIRNK